MRRILLIDDTPEIAELLSFALRDSGYEVHAEGYNTAVNELVLEQRADALVLDCSSYDMSEALPVVIISDTPEKADASLRSRNARRVFLVPKPFSGSQVANALDDLLG